MASTRSLVALIPEVESILDPPGLFFTFDDGKNNRSVAVVKKLEEGFSAEIDRPSCIAFTHPDALQNLIEDATSPFQRVVILDHYSVGKCFSPTCRRFNARIFPQWASKAAFWAVMISPNLPDARVETAARQIRADFWKNFISRLHGPTSQLPYGDPPGLLKRVRRTAANSSSEEPRVRNGHALSW